MVMMMEFLSTPRRWLSGLVLFWALTGAAWSQTNPGFVPGLAFGSSPPRAAAAMPASVTAAMALQHLNTMAPARLTEEAQRLLAAGGWPMSVAWVAAGSSGIRQRLMPLLEQPGSARLFDPDQGVAVMWVPGQGWRSTCYLVVAPTTPTTLSETDLSPAFQHLAEVDGPDALWSFLAGSLISHCMDAAERDARFRPNTFWRMDQTASMGIAPAASGRWFPNGMTGNAYQNAGLILYHDPAQRQYESRLADAMGVLWARWRGAPTRLVNDVIDARRAEPAGTSHATVPSLESLAGLSTVPANLAQAWALARSVQTEVGVDSAVDDGIDDDTAARLGTPLWSWTPPPAPRPSTRGPKPLGGDTFSTLKRFSDVPVTMGPSSM